MVVRRLTLTAIFDPAAVPEACPTLVWVRRGFYDTLTAIEAAMPGLLDHIRTLQDAGSLAQVTSGFDLSEQ